jgi:hypothetical protein
MLLTGTTKTIANNHNNGSKAIGSFSMRNNTGNYSIRLFIFLWQPDFRKKRGMASGE